MNEEGGRTGGLAPKKQTVHHANIHAKMSLSVPFPRRISTFQRIRAISNDVHVLKSRTRSKVIYIYIQE
mgnify:CR=1 FL=1